ncbi:MAG: cob(I)yrinic acid a,c-diamide adenosyltransferase [Deltaproteobacteria bacterium]|jgi:cob(I)alamin adenosyltransferase|nr:cob(I)yrinic acid a,c-diamide adenosyltransferase [Deltaproteobacteria bacterium]
MVKARGLVLVNTGPGKGKTTAALGTVIRALGHGQKVAFIQFIKSQETGESQFLENLARENTGCLHYARHGKGFVGKNPTQADRTLAEDGLELAVSLAFDYDLMVLDEINVAMSLGLLEPERVVGFISNKPLGLNLILTGRGCPQPVMELADTVTEMRDVKHAYRAGIPACPGIDF